MKYRMSGSFALFLGVVTLLWGVLAVQTPCAAGDLEWYRGQLHDHTYWSDGRAFPEQVVDAYKQRGYQFMCISDHNTFAEKAGEWRPVMAEEGDWPPDVTQAIFDAYVHAFGKDWVETRTDGPVTLVRLRTCEEVKARFEEPGRFLLMPGVEITQTLNGVAVHQNYVNLPLVVPCVNGQDLVKKLEGAMNVRELIALNASEVAQAAAKLNAPYTLTLNHPFWVYYDIVPQDLIDCPEVRFFEICNGGSQHAPHPDAASYTPEKFWDAVNAFRRIKGQQILYGLGSDDAHYYDAERINRDGGVGDAWVMVHAEALTSEHLIAAMRRGDFYATTGVLLDDAAFTPEDKTLRIKVKAEEGVHYRIHFITTKQGFDQAVTEIASPAQDKRPARTIPVYSEDIGRTVKTVEGTEAEYVLAADDLYVRARIESDKPSKFTVHFHPPVQTAWTQPWAAE